MIDRAFSSRYRWARRGQRQCVFCACSPGQRSVGGAAHRSGIIPSHRAALVSGDRLQTIAECPSDPRLTPCTATRRSPRCRAATGSRGGTDPAASPTASPPRPASPPGFLRAAYLDIGLAAVHIEQLTGHPAEQVPDLLHQYRIPVRRAGGHSPCYRRQHHHPR